ncbi:hypothetical protein C8R47DRAFT_205484 [Mycena vitilis]|nr:hypothetical protein C8R47DRAFT_205484 [Mycena vitilis]
MFFRSYQVSYSKQIAVPLQTAVEFLHDPSGLMKLSPLIIEVNIDPADSTKYTIVDSLVLPFGYKTKTTYNATITLHDAGLHAESAAGAGTTTKTKYTARRIEDNVTEIEESTTVNAFFLLLPFIKGVIAKAHVETLERIRAKLEPAPET